MQGLGHASSGECFNFSVDRSVIKSSLISQADRQFVSKSVSLSVSQSMSYINQSEILTRGERMKLDPNRTEWMRTIVLIVSDQSYLFPVSLLKWKHKK